MTISTTLTWMNNKAGLSSKCKLVVSSWYTQQGKPLIKPVLCDLLLPATPVVVGNNPGTHWPALRGWQEPPTPVLVPPSLLLRVVMGASAWWLESSSALCPGENPHPGEAGRWVLRTTTNLAALGNTKGLIPLEATRASERLWGGGTGDFYCVVWSHYDLLSFRLCCSVFAFPEVFEAPHSQLSICMSPGFGPCSFLPEAWLQTGFRHFLC